MMIDIVARGDKTSDFFKEKNQVATTQKKKAWA